MAQAGSREGKAPMARLKTGVMLAFLTALLTFSIGCCDHCADLMSLVVSQDSKLFASLCGEYNACVWKASTGKLIHKVEIEKCCFSAVALSPTTDLLATGFSDGTIAIWEWRTGRRMSVLQNPIHKDKVFLSPANARVFSEAFSPNGEELAAAGLGWPVGVWNVKTGTLIRQLTESSIAFQNCTWQESAVVGWNKSDKTCLAFSLAYSPDGKTIAVGSKLWLRLWDAETGALIRTYPGATEIGSIAFSPDGELLAASAEDGSVAIWDARAGARLRAFQLSRKPLRSIVFSPDAKSLAASGWDGNIYIWDPQTDGPVRKIHASRGAVNWVRFSADGANVISGGRDDNLIVTWHIATGKQLRQISCLSAVSP